MSHPKTKEAFAAFRAANPAVTGDAAMRAFLLSHGETADDVSRGSLLIPHWDRIEAKLA